VSSGWNGIDFRVLGPLEVEVDGNVVDLGGPRLRALLALLVAAPGRPVSVSALVEGLWGQRAPQDADRTVRTYMSRLRKALLPASAAPAADVILTRPPGYLLLPDPETIDAVRFERLATSGRQALEAGMLRVAEERLVAALALWRGAAFDEFGAVGALAAEAMRLEQLRSNAVEDRIDVDLAAGQGRQLIAELEGLTSLYPGNERLWGQLMRALYRAGRQSDALETFRRARLLLVAQCGVEPSPVLTAIHQQILAQDRSLLAPHDVAMTAPGGGCEPAAETRPALAAAAHALLVEGDLLTSRQRFEMAYRLAEQGGDSHGLALAMLGLCGLWVHENRTATAENQLRSRLRQALAAVEQDSSLALRLRVRLAGEADYKATEHGHIVAMLDEARLADDPIALVEALNIAHHCVLGPEHGMLRQSLAVELIGESSRTARRIDRLLGLFWHTVDLFLAADPHAERRLGELEDALAEGNHLAIGFAVNAIRVMLTIRSGRFDEAETQARACTELGHAAGDIDAIGWYGGQLVAIRWFQGRLSELLPMLRELAYSPTLSSIDNSYFAALAMAAAQAGDRRTAASSLARLVGRDLADLPKSSTWLATMNGIVETAAFLDDAQTAAQAYDLLSPFAGLPMMASLGVACFGSTHHALGVAAMTTGHLDRAVYHLHLAVRHNLALAHWPAVVRSRARYAEALALRGKPEDAVLARYEAAAAVEEANTLGIPSTVHSTSGTDAGPGPVMAVSTIGAARLSSSTGPTAGGSATSRGSMQWAVTAKAWCC
jgi:DNA-binding SARP family transcriptional activator